jgi:Holliday junction resolvase RusA-like endonuclease
VILEILDPPTGKARPRVNKNGHAWTPAKTKNAEAHVRAAWDRAGRPTLPAETPLRASVRMILERPPSHYTTKGELSAVGRKAGDVPRKKPDVDNAAKLILDALEGYAYPADVAIVELLVTKVWGWPARTLVVVDTLSAGNPRGLHATPIGGAQRLGNT